MIAARSGGDGSSGLSEDVRLAKLCRKGSILLERIASAYPMSVNLILLQRTEPYSITSSPFERRSGLVARLNADDNVVLAKGFILK